MSAVLHRYARRDVGVLSFPIKFEEEGDARAFVKRVSALLEIPCLLAGPIVHVVVHVEDFDTLSAYAGAHGGIVQYGSRWNFQRVTVNPPKSGTSG